jgi:hypothetical protein
VNEKPSPRADVGCPNKTPRSRSPTVTILFTYPPRYFLKRLSFLLFYCFGAG